MNGIKDYKIIRETSLDTLEAMVLSYLNEGWKPIGGIVSKFKVEYCQTIVLSDNKVSIEPGHRKVIMKDPYEDDDDIPF